MAVVVASVLCWIAIMVASTIGAVWAVDLIEAAYYFFWEVHDEED